jgi:hypothetical protein
VEHDTKYFTLINRSQNQAPLLVTHEAASYLSMSSLVAKEWLALLPPFAGINYRIIHPTDRSQSHQSERKTQAA